MQPIGSVFRLKTRLSRLKAELIPRFDSVLRDWVDGVRRDPFADPSYVLRITYVTPPLRGFVERIVDRLDIPGVVGGPLERGFGFGKTHTLIFLWHLFTSDAYRRASINIGDDVVKETLVLGMDYSGDKPFARLIEELRAYIDPRHPVSRVKDPQLLRAVGEVLNEYERHQHGLYALSSRDLAELIARILERYEELGGRPRLLLLIDELGWGLAQKLRLYADRASKGARSEADVIFGEANEIVNFLSYLYATLHGKAATSVIVWVFAEQDSKELRALAMKYRDNETIYNRIEGLLRDLGVIAERYSRGLGGIGLAELSYDPEHALEIARYRILEVVGSAKLLELQERFIEWLSNIARQLNLVDTFMHYREDMRRHYPFSLGLINLLRKVMNPLDVPATEFVRTVITIVGEAAENALERDPKGGYTIGVRHLTIPQIVLDKLLGEFGSDWAAAAADIELALGRIDPGRRDAAELAAKYILAKGVTANILAALESKERREIERYGSTLDEIQLEAIETFTESRAFQIIEKLAGALERLCAESARIEEREVEGKRYYIPSIMRTIYNKLALLIHEEKNKLANKPLIPMYIKQTGTIPSLFVNIQVAIGGRVNDVVVALFEYRKVRDTETLLSDPLFREAQNEGKLLLVIVPPWDLELFQNVYLSRRDYAAIVEDVSRRMQNAVRQGRIRRPLHVVVLLPDLSPYKLNKVIEKLAIFEGTKKFLSHLSKKEEVINERLREFDSILVKRKDLLSMLSKEAKERHLRELRNRLEREISEAKSFAQKQLVRLSRELVINVLELYHKVIYFSIDQNAFTSREIVLGEAISAAPQPEQHIVIRDLSGYASIVNKFLTEIIRELSYEYDAMRIVRALLESYKEDFEKGVIREYDSIDEVVENLMLGAYSVKPLSLNVALEAVKNLDNQNIELEDKIITFIVDEKARLIRFRVRSKKPQEERVETPTENVTELTQNAQSTTGQYIQHVSLYLPPGFDPNDINMRLVALMNTLEKLEAKAVQIELRLELSKTTLSATLRDPDAETLQSSNFKTIMNLLSRLSRRENKGVYLEVQLSKAIAEGYARKIFGEYFVSD